MKARFEFTCDIDVERYCSSAGIALERVRWDALAYITSSIPDLPGLVNTDADRRYHRSRASTRSGGSGTVLRVPRGGPLKVRLGLTVAVERARYAAWSGVALHEARLDLQAYIVRSVEGLPILAKARVPVRWHCPQTLHTSRSKWPGRRTDEELDDWFPAVPDEETWWE